MSMPELYVPADEVVRLRACPVSLLVMVIGALHHCAARVRQPSPNASGRNRALGERSKGAGNCEQQGYCKHYCERAFPHHHTPLADKEWHAQLFLR